jgi:hypothetical protein
MTSNEIHDYILKGADEVVKKRETARNLRDRL